MFTARRSMRLRSYKVFLPPELISYIIDHLHNCPSALLSCALVCRAWVAPSRFHLFYRIEIDTHKNCQKVVIQHCHKLYNLLQKYPDIALYIRELHTSVGGIWLDSTWLDLPRLLGMMTRLRKLKLSGTYWANLAPGIKTSFSTLMALSSLIHVEICASDISQLEHLTTLLSPVLKCLAVSYDRSSAQFTLAASRAVNQEDEMVGGRTLRQLQHLEIDMFDSGPQFVNWLLGTQSVIDHSAVRTLDALLSCHPNSANSSVARLLRHLGSPLESLTIRFPQYARWDISRALTDIVDIECNPNIHSLTFVAFFDVKVVPYLESFLPCLVASNVQQICFDFHAYEFRKWSIRKDWIQIDRILGGGTLGALREVKIRLSVVKGTRDAKSIIQKFVAHFPMLNDLGLLDVQVVNSLGIDPRLLWRFWY